MKTNEKAPLDELIEAGRELLWQFSGANASDVPTDHQRIKRMQAAIDAFAPVQRRIQSERARYLQLLVERRVLVALDPVAELARIDAELAVLPYTQL